MTLLEARIDVCYQTLKELQASLSQLDPELMGYYEKLVSILRSLSACNTRSKFPVKEVEELEEQLKQIQAELKDSGVSHEGRTAEEAYAERLQQVHIDEDHIEEGSKVVSFLLGRCLLWLEIVQKKYAISTCLLDHRLTVQQARQDRRPFPRHIRQTCQAAQHARQHEPYPSLVPARDRLV
jgi:hypothetical protein